MGLDSLAGVATGERARMAAWSEQREAQAAVDDECDALRCERLYWGRGTRIHTERLLQIAKEAPGRRGRLIMTGGRDAHCSRRLPLMQHARLLPTGALPSSRLLIKL